MFSFNSVSVYYNPDNEKGFRSQIYYTGLVNLMSGGEYKVTCTMSVRKFPFDKHMCTLRVASATMSTSTILLNHAVRSSLGIIFETLYPLGDSSPRRS